MTITVPQVGMNVSRGQFLNFGATVISSEQIKLDLSSLTYRTTIITSSIAVIEVHRMGLYRKSRDLIKFLEISANTLETLQVTVAEWFAHLTAV